MYPIDGASLCLWTPSGALMSKFPVKTETKFSV
jgi:hypothetical protein